MARILINNLTRLGDLLQTQALISALHESGHAPYLLCLSDFSAAGALMRHLEGTFGLPAGNFIESPDNNWQIPVHQLLSFKDHILQEIKPDWIINLTPDNPARLLTRLLAGSKPQILGFGMDENGFGQNIGIWASFIAMGARSRHYTPFNLSDMLCRIGRPLISRFSASSSLAVPGKAEKEAAACFISQNQDKSFIPEHFVAFQLGASHDRRRWPVSHFARLGNILWHKARIMPILTGTIKETHLADEYAAHASHPYISAIGKTDLPLLTALLASCKLLVTNDTGTMHLAAGIGTPVLAFFLATASPWDTGPVLENCCCVEPNLSCHPCEFVSRCASSYACRNIVSAETAANLVAGWLKNGDWRAGVSAAAARESRIWVTEKDAAGFFALSPVSGQENDPDVQWLFILREFWSQLLDELDNTPHMQNKMPLSFSGERQKIRHCLQEAESILHMLIKNGAQLFINPKAGELFLKNCKRLESTLDFCKPLASLGVFWNEFQQNQGSDLKFFLSSLKIFLRNITWLNNSLA